MNNVGTGNEVIDSDFLSVLLALKKNVMRSTNCAEVAQIISADGNTVTCKILNTAENVECVYLLDLELAVDDVVLIIFTDTDFRSNLKRIRTRNSIQLIEQETLHTKNCAVIVGIIYRNGGEQ